MDTAIKFYLKLKYSNFKIFNIQDYISKGKYKNIKFKKIKGIEIKSKN